MARCGCWARVSGCTVARAAARPAAEPCGHRGPTLSACGSVMAFALYFRMAEAHRAPKASLTSHGHPGDLAEHLGDAGGWLAGDAAAVAPGPGPALLSRRRGYSVTLRRPAFDRARLALPSSHAAASHKSASGSAAPSAHGQRTCTSSDQPRHGVGAVALPGCGRLGLLMTTTPSALMRWSGQWSGRCLTASGSDAAARCQKRGGRRC